MLRKVIPSVIIVALLLVIGYALFQQTQSSKRYPLLSRALPSAALSDAFVLLQVLTEECSEPNSSAQSATFHAALELPLKQEALIRLLELQTELTDEHFPISSGGLGIDHIAVWVNRRDAQSVTVVGTASFIPTRTDSALNESYFELEEFIFDTNGRLQHRSPHLGPVPGN